MAIKLRVISDQYRELGDDRSRVFGVNGGTVGRAPDNDWILPDPRRVVSGHHFDVVYVTGKYWIDDVSTNGVYINDSEAPVSALGRTELRDGDRLRVGEYEILVSVDARIDFLPAAAEEHSAARHMEPDIGHNLDLDSLFTPRDLGESGSYSLRGVRVDTEARAALLEALQRTVNGAAGETPESAASGAFGRADSVVPEIVPPNRSLRTEEAARPATPSQDWALRTRQITQDELADALARRQTRVDAGKRTAQLHQQASTWTDLSSAVQAFCRGAGIDAARLSPEAQAMLPLVAGQLLREAVVGLNDIAQARSSGPHGPATIAATAATASGSSNPLRTSSSVEQALQRLFESHGRLYAGPVDSLRDVLQETKDHEAAFAAAMMAGLNALLAQLAPANVADQFEQGRARTLAPGQDPRPKYWEHYAEFYRLLTQQAVGDELPRPFMEAFRSEYGRVRAQSRARRSD